MQANCHHFPEWLKTSTEKGKGQTSTCKVKMAAGSVLPPRLMGLPGPYMVCMTFWGIFFSRCIIFAFNDFVIFLYLWPRPISEFWVQHAIEFKANYQHRTASAYVASPYACALVKTSQRGLGVMLFKGPYTVSESKLDRSVSDENLTNHTLSVLKICESDWFGFSCCR